MVLDFNKLSSVVSNFDLEGNVVAIKPFDKGHINKTFTVETTEKRYILQKINTFVFKDVKNLMRNIYYVTSHLRKNGMETLTLILTKNGDFYLQEEDGCYRVYEMIENVIAYQTVSDRNIFRNAGMAFGIFQNVLSSFNAKRLTETIPNFHNTPKRYITFEKAVENNLSNRLSTCLEEVKFVKDRANTMGLVVEGLNNKTIPYRVTHNDTKLNNVLIDDRTGYVRAVIDLDTVMPGSMLYDFGDAIRYGACTADEDEKDLSKVHFSVDLFRAYAEGFCGALQGKITEREKELLPYSAYLISLECGMRFLTDYLDGDLYFATSRAEHNLDRCRTQFRMAQEIAERFEELKGIINEII